MIFFSVGRYLSDQLWHNATSHSSSPERAMAKNKIQFQEGLSLPRFLATYGTEKQCREALFKMRWPQGFRCPKCGHEHCYALQSRKLYQCRQCRFQASLTQGTIFASTNLPLHLDAGHLPGHPIQGRHLLAQPGQDHRCLGQGRPATQAQTTAGHEKPG